MKTMLVYGTILAFCCASCLVGSAKAGDKGPAEITLQSIMSPAKPPKPAQFPHGAHQARLECKTCHHGKSTDGKRLPYSEGQKIEPCETCHNSKAGISAKINTFQKVAHTLCKDCHKANNPELVKCSVCHKK